jgi:hypothetical protein
MAALTDPEIASIAACVAELDKLPNEDTRIRVLRYLASRYTTDDWTFTYSRTVRRGA